MFDLKYPDAKHLEGRNFRVYPKLRLIEFFGRIDADWDKENIDPLLSYLDEAFKKKDREISFHICMKSYTIYTAKHIIELLGILEDYKQSGGSVIVKWFYERFNMDALGVGKGLKEDLDSFVELVPLAEGDWGIKCSGGLGIITNNIRLDEYFQIYPSSGVVEIMGNLIGGGLEELLIFMEQYHDLIKSSVVFQVQLWYFNTANSKLMVDLFESWEDFGSKVKVKWYYANDEIKLSGKAIDEFVPIRFEWMSLN